MSVNEHIKEEIDKQNRIKILNEMLNNRKVNHDEQVIGLSTLKDVCVYCVINNIPSQQYGTLLEKYIRTKFNYIKNKAEDCTGDCSKNGDNIEIKVSLGGVSKNKYNYVQLRPSHNCNVYILIAYHLSSTNVELEGELYIFRISKNIIKKLLVTYGCYAHGTIKKNGTITTESINNNNMEYALRMIINNSCWNELLLFRINESDL
jgi:hypothetical protein